MTGYQSRGRKRIRGRTKAQNSINSPPDPDTLQIAKKVRELLRSQGITHAQLARRSGIHPVTLYQFLDPERYGRGPMRINIIRALAKACRVSIHELIDF